VKTWTIKTIHEGEAVRVDKGVCQEDAVSAIYRAMRGHDPIGAGLDGVNGEQPRDADKALAA
jgi:hypothetical protein